MKKILIFSFIFLLFQNIIAGDNEEFRATWVITWEHINSGRTAEQNKAEVRKILDNHATANMNAVLWQARQGGCAYYNSSFEPWGYYAGYSDPGYDPLAYAIEEAHKRGLELHAWFNVFAASSTYSGAPAAEHPEWVCRDQDGIPMSESRALSPGLEEVREYTINVAMELLRNYDIDGLHLDYVRWNEYSNSEKSINLAKKAENNPRHLDGMVSDEVIKDLEANLAGRYLYDYLHPYAAGVPDGYASWESWWRSSVTDFVQTLHDSIQSVKPWVRLSAAVLGKYNWSGWQGYGTVYQDGALWFNEGYVDQLTPMHYHWRTGQDFYAMLTGDGNESWRPWIQQGIQDGRLYSVGPGSYMLADYGVWGNHPYIVEVCRDISWVDGFQFFSYGSWDDYNYWDKAGESFFGNKTKVRATGLIDSISPDEPSITLNKTDSLNYQLTVNPPATITNDQWFAIYRSEDDTLNLDNDKIIDIHFGSDTYQFSQQFSGLQDFNGVYHYFATTLDRYWNESNISNAEITDLIPSFAPTVVTTAPGEGDTTTVETDVILNFSKTIDISTLQDALTFTPATDIANITWSEDNKTATITVNGDLEYHTNYTLIVAPTVTDVNGLQLDGNNDGNPGDAFELHFYTLPLDNTGPEIYSSYPDYASLTTDFPIDGVISIVFDELAEITTVNNNTVQLYQNGSLQPSFYKMTDINGKSIISLQTSDPLTPDTEYSVFLSMEITDLLGNQLAADVEIPFRTSLEHYSEIKEIDNFLSVTNWEQPSYSGSTVGIVVPNTTFAMSPLAFLPSSSTRQRSSALLRYEWDPSAAEYLIREYASGDPVKAVTFDTTYILQSFVFGDGSNNKFRFSLREQNGEGYPLEVSKWVTLDWYGWKIVEWDLSDPDTVGTWLGNEILDGSSYYIDSYQLTHEEGAELTGKVFFDKLRAVKKTTDPTFVSDDKIENLPTDFQLFQNYPNPFNPTTTISFYLPKQNMVELVLYDLLGREIETLIAEQKTQGFHQIIFDAANLASGIYIYRLKTGNKILSKRMLLMK